MNPYYIGMTADGSIVRYTNITLRDCIRAAYRAQDFQIVGPDWMTNARYEIVARLPAGASMDQIPEMLQSLLQERFILQIRREEQERNVYALVVGKGGPKLKPAEVRRNDDNSRMALGPDGKPRPLMRFGNGPRAVMITAEAANLASLAGLMSRFTARPVIDMTGIDGQYQFNLQFAAEKDAPLTGPGAPDVDAAGRQIVQPPVQSASDALQEYALRLEARKAPVEMFIVSHVEEIPTEN